jgi:hypothetical protein
VFDRFDVLFVHLEAKGTLSRSDSETVSRFSYGDVLSFAYVRMSERCQMSVSDLFIILNDYQT